MRRIFSLQLIISFIWVFSVPAFPQEPYWHWAKGASGPGRQEGKAIAIDGNGNTYIAGIFDISIKLGSYQVQHFGMWDFFVAKYNPAGDVLWAKSFGGPAMDDNIRIYADAVGNITITGCFGSQYFVAGSDTLVNAVSNQTTDIFVVRLNTNGDLVWARSFGGTWWENAFGICGNSAGDVFISGYFESASFEVGNYHLTNKGESDIYVIMIDPAGQIVWVKSFGNTGAETSYAVATDATGNCYLTGSFDSPSLGFGTFTLINSGNSDVFLVKINQEGSPVWGRASDSPSSEIPGDIEMSEHNDICIAGKFTGNGVSFGGVQLLNEGGSDIFLATYDPNGTVKWARSFGGSGLEVITDIDSDSAGNLSMTGYFDSDSIMIGDTTIKIQSSDPDIFITRCNASGDFLWAMGVSGFASCDFSNGLVSDKSGKITLTGEYVGMSLTFGDTTLISQGYFDFFIARLQVLLTGSNNKQSNDVIVLSPNPNHGDFSIILGESFFGESDVQVFNINGEEVLHEHFDVSPSARQIKLHLKKPVPGIYIYRIRNALVSKSGKLLITGAANNN